MGLLSWLAGAYVVAVTKRGETRKAKTKRRREARCRAGDQLLSRCNRVRENVSLHTKRSTRHVHKDRRDKPRNAAGNGGRIAQWNRDSLVPICLEGGCQWLGLAACTYLHVRPPPQFSDSCETTRQLHTSNLRRSRSKLYLTTPPSFYPSSLSLCPLPPLLLRRKTSLPQCCVRQCFCVPPGRMLPPPPALPRSGPTARKLRSSQTSTRPSW
jgi:hypothetical protein